MNKPYLYLSLSLALLSGGCVSYRSTIMSRTPDDRMHRNSNQCTRGVPVTLKIPTHMDVRIEEEYFITQAGDKTAIPQLSRSLRSVAMHKVYTPKVVTVDFVRPGAGTLALADGQEDGIKMDPEGYFASIQAKIDDQTLTDITAQKDNLAKILGKGSLRSAKAVSAGGENIDAGEAGAWQSYKTIIAYKRFDISEPGWEMAMQEFVDQYIQCQNNQCLEPECLPGHPQ
jgi:hypothetical protein